MEEKTIVAVEVTTEDKIAKLKATIEGMELLGETIPQTVKDAVTQELANLEAKALEETQKVQAETVSFYNQHKTEIIVIAAILLVHVAGKLGF